MTGQVFLNRKHLIKVVFLGHGNEYNEQGRPEFGGLDPRWQFAAEQFQGNRAFWAFVLDLGLYSVWQAVLMGDSGAPSKYRYIPFFGLAAWLLVDGGSLSKGLRSGFWDSPDD